MNKQIKTLLSVILFTISFGAFSQNVSAANIPYVAEQKIFSDVSVTARHIEATSDGGSIIIGSGNIDKVVGIYVAKLDSDGNKTWQKSIPNLGVGVSIKPTSDNCYIAISSNKHVIKLDSNGNVLWDKILSDAAELNSIEPTKDNNFIICGSSRSDTSKYDVYICKIDVDGNIIFSNNYGTSNNDFGASIQQTVDGGYIILGSTMPSPNYYMYLVKVDRNGNLLWSKSVGAKGGTGKDIKVAKDGSFIIAGQIDSKGALLKTNSSGNLLWSKILNDKDISSVELDTDGFMLVGCVRGSSSSTDTDAQIIKTDLSGNKVWNYETTEYNSRGYFRSITKALDGSFLIIGDTNAGTYGDTSFIKVKY
ncbi:TPA: PQQ-binding-like beta-propeller repeat protein [Clostridium botulinum]|uniref:outer membrane protein assembly factor BamB family protein n=1 Tax=Clostridium sporogenes TaxID=1509 RepID=UPI0033129195|nr:PQQ-binding-like beta-propeller repeat protein [Clostridium botulinum]